ncbi:MAG: CHRD domain-containing protein [Acidobacteriota bacterium]
MLTKFVSLALLASFSLLAQSAESIPFRLNMSPQNEVPAVTGLDATGFGTVWLHVLRDSSGRITSGTVDFNVRYQFPGEVTFTGLHIHRGNAGANGPVLIDSRITAGNPVVDASGRGAITRSAEIAPGSPNVAVLSEIINSPDGFYLNLHSTANPGGAVRAQLARTERRVFGVPMLPENEVPIVNSEARGIAFVTVLSGFTPNGALSSAEVTFDLNYTGFAEGTQFTGMHIHTGRAGANGPVTIDTGLTRAQNILAGQGGAGSLRYVVDVNMANQNSVNTILGIWGDPGTAYLNLHTVANPGGEIRGQLRGTEAIRLNTSMLPSNEVPPITSLDASAAAQFEVNLLRRPNGEADAALAVFNVNYRFPAAEVTFTGLHIHTGAAGANDPVTIDSGIRAGSLVVSPNGSGNIYRTTLCSTPPQLNSLNAILANPANQYLNLHTTANPGGAVRAQLAAPNSANPAVDIVLSAISDINLRTVAPGGLLTIYGTNLALLAGNLDGWQAGRVPPVLNATSAAIDGRPAAILMVDPRYILAQVPTDTPAGTVDLVVRNTNGSSPAFRINVANTAPAIFFDAITADGNRAVAYLVSSGEQITAANPAAGGQVIGVFGTGFGIATPRQRTGEVEFAPGARYPGVRVTVGGQEAREIITSLIPGYVGFTQTIFQVPANLRGAQALEVEYSGIRSNRTILYLR